MNTPGPASALWGTVLHVHRKYDCQSAQRGCRAQDGELKCSPLNCDSPYRENAGSMHAASLEHLAEEPDPEESACGTVTAAGSFPAADHGCSPQIVKNVCAIPPHIDRAILAQALIIKAVHLQQQAACSLAVLQSPSCQSSVDTQHNQHLGRHSGTRCNSTALSNRDDTTFSRCATHPWATGATPPRTPGATPLVQHHWCKTSFSSCAMQVARAACGTVRRNLGRKLSRHSQAAHLCDLAALMVPPNQHDPVWIAHLQFTTPGVSLATCAPFAWSVAGAVGRR